MATISVRKVQPYRNVKVETFDEAASQTFVRGDLLTLGVGAAGHRVLKATSGTTVTGLVGFAAEAATGTTGTKLTVYLADDDAEFVANVCTAVSADDVCSSGHVGDIFGLIEDTTNAAWRVNLSETTAANKICMVTKLVDATGDTNGRVVFKILKSLADTSASGYFINNVRVF